jgi:hypothetical protein
LVERRPGQIGQHDLHAHRGKAQRSGQTDAARCAGHDRHVACIESGWKRALLSHSASIAFRAGGVRRRR